MLDNFHSKLLYIWREKSYNNQQFHDEELMFLTSLHSHTNRRIKQFFERLIELNFNPMTPNTDVIFLNSRNERRNFCEYTFTFDEIHKWIEIGVHQKMKIYLMQTLLRSGLSPLLLYLKVYSQNCEVISKKNGQAPL